MDPGNPNLTELLLAWGAGDMNALDALTPLVYDHLHRLARHYMAGERPGHTLQATALVNEAYLRLVDSSRVRWQNRAHFFALAAQLMRRILVDAARSRGNQKRGGDMHRTTLDEALMVSGHPDPDLVALDEALVALTAVDPRKGKPGQPELAPFRRGENVPIGSVPFSRFPRICRGPRCWRLPRASRLRFYNVPPGTQPRGHIVRRRSCCHRRAVSISPQLGKFFPAKRGCRGTD